MNEKNIKLVPHLMDKKNGCNHYRNLKYVMDLDLQVNTFHNTISFKRRAWLNTCIDFNVENGNKQKHIWKICFHLVSN